MSLGRKKYKKEAKSNTKHDLLHVFMVSAASVLFFFFWVLKFRKRQQYYWQWLTIFSMDSLPLESFMPCYFIALYHVSSWNCRKNTNVFWYRVLKFCVLNSLWQFWKVFWGYFLTLQFNIIAWSQNNLLWW